MNKESVELKVSPDIPSSKANPEEVWIPTGGEEEAAVAAHEIGHHVLRLYGGGDSLQTFKNEIAVWKWVLERAPQFMRYAVKYLLKYLDNVEGEYGCDSWEWQDAARELESLTGRPISQLLLERLRGVYT